MLRCPILAVAALCACGGSLSAQDPIDVLVERLGSANRRVSIDAYRKLRATKSPKMIPLLARNTTSYDRTAQVWSMHLLRMFPFAETEQTFRGLLRSESPFVRVAAGGTLFIHGDPSTAPTILAALTAAGEQGTADAGLFAWVPVMKSQRAAAVVRGLVRPGAEISQVQAALSFLARHDLVDEASRRTARDVLEQSRANDRIRGICAAFLVGAGDTSFARDAADVLVETPALVNQYYDCLARAPKLGDSLVDALVDIVASRQRGRAVALLSLHQPRRAVEGLRKLLDHEDPAVSRAALNALSKITGALRAADLSRLLATGSTEVALIAADALRRMDDPSGLARVVEITAQPGPHRVEAVRVLAGFRDPEVVIPLIAALNHPELPARHHAYLGLVRVLQALYPYRRFDLESTGYQPTADAAARQRGASMIQEWWKTNRPSDR